MALNPEDKYTLKRKISSCSAFTEELSSSMKSSSRYYNVQQLHGS